MKKKPRLRLVREVDVEVHEQWTRTQAALDDMREAGGDPGFTPRDCCDRFATSSKKKLMRVIDTAIENSDTLFDGLTTISIHSESSDDGWEFVVKFWASRQPRLYYTEEMIRACVLWAKAAGVTYAGWQTSIAKGG
jgi:hypothetical protein